MSLPTMQEARSRQTAMEAERHWWVTKLKANTAWWRECCDESTAGGKYVEGFSDGLLRASDVIDALIAERECP